MKPTLYEALGLSPAAGDAEIKSALRRLVRRYYGKTRAGHADVEEALRFLNHASHVLGDPARRSQYDADLAEGTRTETTLTFGGEPSDIAARPASSGLGHSGISITDLGLPRDRMAPPPIELAPQWSVQLAEIRRTRAGQLAGLLIVSFIFLLVWNLAVPSGGAFSVIKFALVGGVLVAALGAACFGGVHLVSQSLWELPAAEGPITIVEGMIPRWRRDRTVFVGTGAHLEDATWLFRLRMAELKRVSAERVSDPRPTMRFLARVFDYALWTMLVFGALGFVRPLVPGAALAVDLLSHPLVAPIWITLTWVPVEAFLLARAQTTPGRWLLCVYLNYQISNPYSPEEVRFTFGAALRRAYEVWWRGCAGWLPFAGFVAMARAQQQLKRSGETSWDSRRDCLVTHGPVGALSMVTMGLGLAACALTLGGQWNDSVQSMGSRLQQGSFGFTPANQSPLPGVTKPLTQSRVSRIDDMASREIPATSVVDTSAAASSAAVEPAAAPPVADVPVARPAVVESPAVAPPAALSSAPESTSREPAAPSAPAVRKSSVPESAHADGAGSAASSVVNDVQPTSMELLNKRVAVYARQAQRQQSAGDYAGLARTCRRWADEDWRNPRAFYCAGIGLQGIGQHKHAIDMFNQAGALLPKDDPLKTLIADAVLRSFRAEAQH